MHRRVARAVRYLLAVLVAFGLPLLASGAARAHPGDPVTMPADGAQLDRLEFVMLHFDEPVMPAGDGIRVVGPAGELAVSVSRADGGRTVVAEPSEVARPGPYTVAWRVLAMDSHVLRGEFAFEIVGPAAPASVAAPVATAPSRSPGAGAAAGPATADVAPAPAPAPALARSPVPARSTELTPAVPAESSRGPASMPWARLVALALAAGVAATAVAVFLASRRARPPARDDVAGRPAGGERRQSAVRASGRTDVLLVATATSCAVALIAAAGFASSTFGDSAGQLASHTARAPISWEEASEVLGGAAVAAQQGGPAGAPGSAPPGRARTSGADQLRALEDAVAARRTATQGAHTHGGDSHGDHSHAAPGQPGPAGSPAHAHGDDHHNTGGDHHAGGDHDGEHEHGTGFTGRHPEPQPGPDGLVEVPMLHQTDRDRVKVFGDPTGQISPWEVNYESPIYAEEGCGVDVLGLLFLPELNPTKQCTMTHAGSLREGDPADYFSAHGDHGPCRVTPEQYAGGFDMARRSRAVVTSMYDNNPVQALVDGYKPYPVPATKSFHMFKNEHWNERDNDGNPVLYNPFRPSMFTYAMTDDGLMVVNIVYTFSGTAQELPDGQQARWNDLLPRPFGCMVEWHGHFEGVEGPATGNLDGREFMTHVWTWPRAGAVWEYGGGKTYEGPYPFGEYLDGTEGHAWFTPFSYVPALCNKDGGCI